MDRACWTPPPSGPTYHEPSGINDVAVERNKVSRRQVSVRVWWVTWFASEHPPGTPTPTQPFKPPPSFRLQSFNLIYI